MSFPRTALKFAAVASLALAGTAHAAVEIQWWHAMQGALNDKVNEIADKFNASQSDYKIVPVNKGNYDETMAVSYTHLRAHETLRSRMPSSA